jgi:hypothetical protein
MGPMAIGGNLHNSLEGPSLVMGPMGLTAKDEYADEGQQQFTTDQVSGPGLRVERLQLAVWSCIVSSHYLAMTGEDVEYFM